MRSSIRKRTFIYITSGMLIIIAAFSVLFFRYFYDVFSNRIEEEQLYASEKTQESFSAVITNIRENAYSLCINTTLANLLTSGNANTASSQNNEISINFSMSMGTFTTPQMQSAYAMLFVDSQFPHAEAMKGLFSLEGGYYRRRVYSALDVQEEAWYRRTMELNGQIFAFREPQDPTRVFVSHLLRSVRIADPRYNSNIGMVVYAMPESAMLKTLQSARITDGAVALLLFGDQLLLSTDTELFPVGGMDADDLAALLALPGSGKTAQITLDGRRYTASGIRFEGDWQSVLLIPDSDIYYYVWAPMSLMIVVVILFLMVAALISFVLSIRLMKPIIALSDTMAQAQDRGSLPPPVVAPQSDDEIAVLYDSYNRMTERIRRLLEQSAEEAEKLHSAQIKAMQAQINPHFIYNTLDSISCSALLEGNNDIVTMVASLISILKYRVDFTRTVVPLGEELDNLVHYIRIQELRFKNSFQYQCEVDEKYFDVPISPIVLQPLVENALFHAQSYDAPLQIRLYCEETGGRLRIHVADNGEGGSAEKLNALLASEQPQSDDRHGVGIRNVNMRIRLLFGEGSGLHYEQLPEGGLDSVIEIPHGRKAPGQP